VWHSGSLVLKTDRTLRKTHGHNANLRQRFIPDIQMQSLLCPPVLFLVFNRPDLTAESFAAIRLAKPKQLFIAADGPRADRPAEKELCERVREIATKVDWSCDVKTLFREHNLGCRDAVRLAIDWFYGNVEEGIVLEDDCLPEPTFFPYCATLLERYRHDERIMCVTGNNFQKAAIGRDESYYYSIYNHCWGWASWRRAWACFDNSMADWPALKTSDFLSGFLRRDAANFWRSNFDSVYESRVNTWDYVWTYTCWANSGLTVVPNVNLVNNIGFDSRATHTTRAPKQDLQSVRRPIQFPLIAPRSVCRSVPADHFTEDCHFRVRRSLSKKLLKAARSCFSGAA
jgi:hypothetical protein